MPNPTKKFYYYGSTAAGSFWELKPGHIFEIEGKTWVCSGFLDTRGVYIAHENRIILVDGSATELWSTLSVRLMSARAVKNWNKQDKRKSTT